MVIHYAKPITCQLIFYIDTVKEANRGTELVVIVEGWRSQQIIRVVEIRETGKIPQQKFKFALKNII